MEYDLICGENAHNGHVTAPPPAGKVSYHTLGSQVVLVLRA